MTDESGPTQATGEDAAADGGTDERGVNENGTGDDVAPTADGSAGGGESTGDPIGLAAAKDAAVDAAEELIDHPIDSVIRIERDGEGWRTLIEVVERSAIPDTQDILGRYEIVVDDAGTLVQYGLEERYRRGENREEL